MPTTVVLLAALLSGLAAVALTPWMCAVARTHSFWLGSGLHTLLATFGGAGAATLARGWAELVAFMLLTLACALLVVIDLSAYRLPDLIVGPMYPILFAALTVTAAISGEWDRLGRAAVSAGVLVLSYFVLALIAPSGLGLGDVKLSGLLGAFLGWLGWSNALVGTFAAFILNGVVALVVLLMTRATRRTAIAFGPWMVAGTALGAAWGPVVLPGIG